MDNLTHSLVGAALGRAGLYRRTRYAAGALIIGANLPDIDVLGLLFGQNLAFRRGITHGPIALAVLPLVLAGFLVWLARLRPSDKAPEVKPSQLVLLSYIGVLTHPALDWLNTYGIRLLMPFSDTWFYGDSIFIIDPYIWIALGAGVLIARRRFSRRTAAPTRPARAALLAVSLYIAAMFTGSRTASRLAHDHVVAETGETPLSVMAGPVPANPFARQIIVAIDNRYRHGRVNFVGQPRLAIDSGYPINRELNEVQRAIGTGAFDDFLYWSRFPFFVVTAEGDSTRVSVGDARFGSRGGVANSFSRSVLIPSR